MCVISVRLDNYGICMRLIAFELPMSLLLRNIPCELSASIWQFRIAARSITSRRNSAEAVPAHLTGTGTVLSMILAAIYALASLLPQLWQSQEAQSETSQLHSSSEPEETVVYTGEACSHVSQNGISFHFPASESKCRVELRFKVVNDDYVLPKGYEDMPLVSSMFKITASDELPVPVTVQMEHCAIIEEDDSLDDVQGKFFGYVWVTRMCDRIRRGSFKVVLLPAAVVQQLKGRNGRIELFGDFKVTSVKIDGEYIYSVEEVTLGQSHNGS